MQNHKIKIRAATFEDGKSIFDWRKDVLSTAMSFSNKDLTFKEHINWFNQSLLNSYKKFYIGEVNDTNVGVCRFDFNKIENYSEVSININPEVRGRGLGKIFLCQCVDDYLEYNERNLIAKIIPQNQASINIFRFAGFEKFNENENVLILHRPFMNFRIKEVEESDAQILFELLKKRAHSISHQKLPSECEHLAFVKSKPYRFWAVVFEGADIVGSFYIQYNNSIGLNLPKPSKTLVKKLLNYIKCNFEPAKEVKSKIPAYYYLNIAHGNEELKRVLFELNAVPIQTSFKIM